MEKIVVEIIAIGDEIVSGQRLDTNSQWLSCRLGEIGIEPSFHTTVGDSFNDGLKVLSIAAERADVIVTTGGIGPTQDDLTRQIVAKLAGVELVFHQEIEDHIRSIFASYGRSMPPNNRIQAMIPEGATAIWNGEGTAPGIDLKLVNSRLFALPGVPYEMQKMWFDHLQHQIANLHGRSQSIKHHVIHCFGAGESQIEELLDGLTKRNQQPRVGITASKSTISLRITAMAENDDACDQLIRPVEHQIRKQLGSLIFGENGEELQDCVAGLLQRTENSVAFIDFAFNGAAYEVLSAAADSTFNLAGGFAETHTEWKNHLSASDAADFVRQKTGANIGLAISPILSELSSENHSAQAKFTLAIIDGENSISEELRHGGHSGLRHERTIKQILNRLRLFLLKQRPFGQA